MPGPARQPCRGESREDNGGHGAAGRRRHLLRRGRRGRTGRGRADRAHLADGGAHGRRCSSRPTVTSGTISTHFFRGDGLVRGLAEIGVLDEVLATGAPRLTCDYWYPDAGERPEIDPPRSPATPATACRYAASTLDPLLAARVAERPGVTWLSHRRVVGWSTADDGVGGVVDADRCPAPRAAGGRGRRPAVDRRPPGRARPTQREHAAARLLVYRYLIGYDSPDEQDGAEFSLRGNEMAYAFPSDQGVTCLAVTVPIDPCPHGVRRPGGASSRPAWPAIAASGAGTPPARSSAGSWPAAQRRLRPPGRRARVGARRRRGHPPGPVERVGHGHGRAPGTCPGRCRGVRRRPLARSGTPRHATRSRSRATRRPITGADDLRSAPVARHRAQASKRSSSTCGGRSAGRGPV